MVAKVRKRERRKITPKEKTFRALLHIMVGVFIFELAWFSPILSLVATWLFLKYELNEDDHLKDQAWVDIFGAILGFALAYLFHFGILILQLWRNDFWAWGNYFTPKPLPQFNH